MVRGKYWPKKNLLCHSCGVSQCWETRIGQEMFKLTLFDLLINVAVLVLVEFPRRYGQLCHHITLEVNALHDSVMFFLFFLTLQNAGGQRVQQAGSVIWSAGVCGSLQCAGACLRSDCGLDGGLVLPSAAPHQRCQVYHPVLHQEGDSSRFNISNLHGRDCFVFFPLLDFNSIYT